MVNDPEVPHNVSAQENKQAHVTKVIILAWERPLYLWCALDSLYRHTRTPAEFILIDNNSQNSLVREIIGAFDRRGMFTRVIHSPFNDPKVIAKTIDHLGPELGQWFAYIEGDVVIESTGTCWLETMIRIMKAQPELAMLGSQIDRSDFIDVDWAVGRFGGDLKQIKGLVKATSPERNSWTPPGELGDPHNPPGRLLMLRTAAVQEVGWASDSVLYKRLLKRGYKCAISGDVVHRHLSLLNVFDYSEYDPAARAEFWRSASE